MSHEKLIRDKIPLIIAEKGESASIRIVGDRSEMIAFLLRKVSEESREVQDSGGDIEEMADLIEVLMALAREKGIDWQEVEKTRVQKKEERGGFEKGYILSQD